MKKMIIAAMVLLVAQIGLALALNMSKKGISAGAPDTLFVSFSPDAVHSLAITGGDKGNILIEKGKDGWILPDHFKAPVDGKKVNELIDKLAGIKQGFVVATTPDAAKRFKVDADSFEDHVVLKSEGKTLADFYVGTSPGFRQIHARRAESKSIVAIPLSTFELETKLDKWLDTSVGTIKDEDLVGLSIGDLNLKKETDGWKLEGVKEGEQVNQQEVDTLVTKARGLAIEDVFDPAKAAELIKKPEFQFTAALKDGRKVDYLFAKEDKDSYVMKMSDRKPYFKVHNLLVDSVRNLKRNRLVKVAKVEDNKVASAVGTAESTEQKVPPAGEKAQSAQ